MAPFPTETREQSGVRPTPIGPYPSIEILLGLSKEIVVDWQLQSTDTDRKA